jgi:predicted RNase H-like nuclease
MEAANWSCEMVIFSYISIVEKINRIDIFLDSRDIRLDFVLEGEDLEICCTALATKVANDK